MAPQAVLPPADDARFQVAASLAVVAQRFHALHVRLMTYRRSQLPMLGESAFCFSLPFRAFINRPMIDLRFSIHPHAAHVWHSAFYGSQVRDRSLYDLVGNTVNFALGSDPEWPDETLQLQFVKNA